MIYLALALLAVASLAPLATALVWQSQARGRRDSAMAIHRQQLTELDRDLAEGRIAPAEHATALLEVQRRLLAAEAAAEPDTARASRLPLLAALALVPLLAAGLYAIDAHPGMPAAPFAARNAQEAEDGAKAAQLIAQLRTRLESLDPKSPLLRQGYILLGNAENSRGNLPDAAAAWRRAVELGFDPDLAALTAEAQSEVEGKVSADSAGLFRRALEAAPATAAWRAAAEARLKEVGGK